jgi:hypothetical protein
MTKDSEESQDQNLSLEFGIKKVKELDFVVHTSADEIQRNSFDPNKLNFDLSFAFKHKLEQEEFSIVIIASYKYGDNKENSTEYVHIKAEVTFLVKELNKFFDEEKDALDLPEPLMASLFGIAFSTTRGFLCARVKGTVWEDHHLPIVKPTEVIRKHKENNQD